MLVGFSIKNFKSFRERAIIKMNAGKGRKHKNHYTEINNKKVLKTAMIFGANASGKSNFINAMSFSKNIIINGIYESISNSYFRIDDSYAKNPGVFDYNIIIGDKEYSYGVAISYEREIIISEWLYIIKNTGREVCVFDRKLGKDKKYTVENDPKYNNIKNRCYDVFVGDVTKEISKKTIVSDIAERNKNDIHELQDIINIYNWFNKKLMIVYPTSIYMGINESRNDHLLEIKEFDTGIEDIRHKDIEKPLDSLFKENRLDGDNAFKKIVMKQLSLNKNCPFTLIDGSTIILKDLGNGMVSYRIAEFNHGNPNNLFKYSEESDGTKRLLDLLPFYKLDEDVTIVVDEIDRSLHTIVLREFLNRFYSKCCKQCKQIIMTTHDTNIMDLELLRQDEIWFVERDKYHNSSLFSLNKFKVHFDTIVERNYLMGRYGGLPVINQIIQGDIDDE